MNYAAAVSIAIAIGSLIVAGMSAKIAWKSVETAREQLAFVKRKIGMVSEPSQMTEILPIWYVNRMSQDTWGFGLLLASGDILAIGRIAGVSDDGNWLEVTLLGPGEGPKEVGGRPVLYAALKDRRQGSVRVDQVQAAFELLTS